MHNQKNSEPNVANGNRAIDVNRNDDMVAVTGQVLVDGIVEHFKDAVVQAALVGIADVHAGALANRFETLEFIDLRRVVFLAAVNSDRKSTRLNSSHSQISYAVFCLKKKK